MSPRASSTARASIDAYLAQLENDDSFSGLSS